MENPKQNKNLIFKNSFLNTVFNKLLVISIFALFSTVAYAVPAPDEFIEMQQPDGSVITVKIQGDERINWFENQDGYTLLYDDNGYIVFATQNENGDLIPSTVKYFSAENLKQTQNAEFQNFLEKTPKKLWFSSSQVEEKLEVWRIKDDMIQQIKSSDEFQNSSHILGTRKYLVILMGYQDRPFVRTRQEFDDMFNKENFHNANLNMYGSVRDFFIENSYGKFIPEFTVVGPFTANNNLAYYRNRGGELAREAVIAARNNTNINFAQFDNTNNGSVDAITLVFAGYCRASGGGQNAIWSHAGQISGHPSLVFDGKHIQRYNCSPELRGNSGNVMATIGTATHEFGHAIGSPDYYDTDYEEQGQWQGAGNWCLMASGCNIQGGARPSHFNMYQKIQFGWVTPEVLNVEGKDVTMLNSAEHPVAYRINTSTTNEYFILENRQQVGFDTRVPGTGLLIWRVHSQINNSSFFGPGWNCINCKHPQGLYPVNAGATFAIPTADPPASYGAINNSGTPFPGSSTPPKTSFTDNTIPSAKAWNGQNTIRPIRDIKNENQIVTFNYPGRPAVVWQVPYFFDFGSSANFTQYTRINAGSDGHSDWQRRQDGTNNWVGNIRGISGAGAVPNNAWLITPAITMTTGYIYTLTVAVRSRGTDRPEALAVYIGNNATVAAQNKKILDLPEITNDTYQNFTAEFTVPAEGYYYLGFHSYSGIAKEELFVNTIRIDQYVGIEDRDVASSINIYPNPTDGNIIIDNSENIFIERIEISDITGKLLSSMNYGNDNNIDLSALNPGTYWITFHTANGVEIKRVVKK